MKYFFFSILTLVFAFPTFAQLRIIEENQATTYCAFDIYNGIGVIHQGTTYQLLCAQTSNRFDSGLFITLGETKEEAINTLGDLRSLCNDEKGKEIVFDAGNNKTCIAIVENNYLRLSSKGMAGFVLIHQYTIGSLMKNLSFNESHAVSLEEYTNSLDKEEIAKIRYWNTRILKIGDCYYLSAALDGASFDIYLGSTLKEADLTLRTYQEFMKMDKSLIATVYGSSAKVYSVKNESLLEKMITFRAEGYDKYSIYGAYLSNLISKLNYHD